MQLQLITTLLVALVLITLTIQNPNPVPIQFMSWGAQRGIPLIVIILVSLLAGVVTSAFLGLRKQLKLRERIRALEKDLMESRHPMGGGDEDLIGEN